MVMHCWHRFDENFVPDDRFPGMADGSYGVDTNWYTDTGATDHVTGELEKLSVCDRYKGGDQIHTTNEAGMEISHIGHSVIKTPYRNLYLNNILYTPQAKRNIASVHRIVVDNFAFLEFHSNFFVIKDKATKKVLLRGPYRRGLYPLSSSSLLPASIKQAYGVNKPSFTTWHSRLGHPASPIVEKVISLFTLPHCKELNKQSVCDAYQKAKSHRLPYPKSSSILKHPLELIFSDVWGPAPMSVGGKKYYVSFVDDYSKFTWIYTLKFKSEVFQKFHEFQQLVERMFNKKIIAMQTDWGGEYQKLHSFFTKIGITHLASYPHAHQ
jgi:hypothetical protein